MSRKLEIKTRMAEVQKEFAALNAEMKEIDLADKKMASRDKYKEYLFKVGTYGYTLDPPEKIQETTEDDRDTGHHGASGLMYTGYEGRSQAFGYVMMKSKEEYPRVQRILALLEAAAALSDDKVHDKEKYIKILLGETDGQEKDS